eukprot:2760083-Amphidinium_carterae.1
MHIFKDVAAEAASHFQWQLESRQQTPASSFSNALARVRGRHLGHRHCIHDMLARNDASCMLLTVCTKSG